MLAQLSPPSFLVYEPVKASSMSFDLKLFGRKVRKRRSHLDIEIRQLSAYTGIPEQRITTLESGIAEPTGDEILVFADFFQVDYNYFISNQSDIASDRVDILYRFHGDDFKTADRRVIQEFIFLCECEAFIFNKLGLVHKEFEFKPSGEFYKTHGEEAAHALRKFLGVVATT